jgi:UDP-N-acetylmuramoyl-tripeptide--D-alanyl-D-alanine ligase
MTSFLLSIIVFLINGLSVLRFYQIKDYLLSRARAHFYLPSSKKLVLNPKEYLLYTLFLLSLFLNFFVDLTALNYRLDFLIFLLIILFIWRFNLIKKIHFTLRTIVTILIQFGLIFFIFWLTKNHLTIFIVLSLWTSQFIFFTFSNLIFQFVSKPYLLLLANRAKKKLNQYSNLKIIGIVGSYGKSTTKEFFLQLLSKKYKVLSPPSRVNHELALLRFVLKTNLKNFDFLIIEFGSYYLGNIKWITKYITPQIAFITGITKQHLFLFGNIENIIKGEGVEILTWMKEGILFVNQNTEYFEKLMAEIKKEKNPNIKLYFYLPYEIESQDLEKTIFRFKNKIFETKIIFPMQIENLSGVLSYISLIDNLDDYEDVIKNLELPDGFLKLKIKNNLYIFDDSYNANPQGVFSSLNFFKKLNFDFKIIIFNGLFELGKETEKIYQELSKELLNFDKIILTSDDYFRFFKNLLNDKVMIIKSQIELKILLNNLNKSKTGIWVINRLPKKLIIY